MPGFGHQFWVYALYDARTDQFAELGKPIQSVINQIVFYLLKDFDEKMKTKHWAQAPAISGPKSDGAGETKWVVADGDSEGAPLDGRVMR